MHERRSVEAVLELHRHGVCAAAIARQLAIPRSTVRDWVRGSLPKHPHGPHGVCGIAHEFGALPPAYPYLLGLYLGDGWISAPSRRVPKLRIALDAAYPGIIAEAMHAVTVLRGKAPGLAERPRHCVEVYSHWRHWLPQHGPGKKHTREIHLSEWQIALVDVWPHQLLRGLIHSDGCRFTNTGRRWSAPRYAFKQVSSDIRLIFCAACERLGVHWTEAPETIYVSRKADVALLDTFIGPKR